MTEFNFRDKVFIPSNGKSGEVISVTKYRDGSVQYWVNYNNPRDPCDPEDNEWREAGDLRPL